MSNDEEILSRESMKSIREEAFRLVQVKDKLEEALQLAGKLRREPSATEIKRSINSQMDRIDSIFATRTYFRSIRNIKWWERIWISLKEDVFLNVATKLSLIAAAFTIYLVLQHIAVSSLPLLDWIMRLFVSPAHAQALAAGMADEKSVMRIGIFAAITIAFFWALLTLGFANRADTRKLAADTIKMILGVYLGMLTRFAG